MGVLTGLEPNKVFHFFEEICSIPHGSGNVEKISNYLVDFAKERDLKYRQDEKYNVIIWKDGSAGYENSDPVILQGHMDMVAVKVDGCEKNLDTEGLDLEVNGDLISAKGTSLGGDDGIAVAYTLAILDDDSMAHPPIEAIFTVDEEIGMLGATDIVVSDLKGRLFMNMDSEDEGVFTVSCAGGAMTTCSFPYKTETVEASVIEIRLDGFAGGHSGVEIDKGRMNANVAMGRVLMHVLKKPCTGLSGVNGGEKDNAIAKLSEAVLSVAPECVAEVTKLIEDIFEEFKEEHKTTDPDMALHINVKNGENVSVMTEADARAVVTAIINLPNGIQRMNPEMKDMVQTSLNLGVLKTEADKVVLSYAVRSSSETEKWYLVDSMRNLVETLGGTVDVSGVYPGWEYRAESRLRDVMVEEYKKQYGSEPVVEGIHAGLECGIFASKLDGLDAVSFGPQMENIHTIYEVLSISSTKRTWDLVVSVLAALK